MDGWIESVDVDADAGAAGAQWTLVAAVPGAGGAAAMRLADGASELEQLLQGAAAGRRRRVSNCMNRAVFCPTALGGSSKGRWRARPL